MAHDACHMTQGLEGLLDETSLTKVRARVAGGAAARIRDGSPRGGAERARAFGGAEGPRHERALATPRSTARAGGGEAEGPAEGAARPLRGDPG